MQWNTLFIVKTTSNYVFGGFVHVNISSNAWVTDPNAFLYRLRINGTMNFNILRSGGTSNDPTAKYSFHTGQAYGPLFGYGWDLYISPIGNASASSYSNLCNSYECPGNFN
jgi:hypothetical protein